MRVLIVATLLFFNIALALWHFNGGGRDAAERVVPRTEPDIAPLELWRERSPRRPEDTRAQ